MHSKLLLMFTFIFFPSLLLLYAQDVKIPDYSTVPRKDVPVQYQWKISDIYPSVDAWQYDKEKLKVLLSKIDETSKDWTASPQKMLAMLSLADDINLKTLHLYSYGKRQYDTDMSNSLFQNMKGEIQSLSVDANLKLTFINNDLLKMEEKTLERFLMEVPKLEPYRFFIEQVIRSKKHILPLEQENLMALTGLYGSTISEAATVLNDVDKPCPEITLSTGEKVALNYANYFKYRSSINPEDRALVMRTYWNNHKQFENTLAVLFDGGMKQDLFNSRARKFNNCLEARLFGDNIDTTVYSLLIDAVKKNLAPLHRYLKLKQKMLGLQTMKYEDIYASPVKKVDKLYSYEDAKGLILNSLKPLGDEYHVGLKKAFNDGWIDIYPNMDKESGAYSGGIYDIHPFIKMNYNGEYDAVSTLTHELGHSLHSYLSSKSQPYINSGYTTFIAEIASTFNENMLMDYMLKNEKDDLFKLYIISEFLEQVRGTLYRQSLFADFELAMHKKVEKGQSLTPEWLNKKYLDLTRLYYGNDIGVMQVDDFIQSEWGNIPHFFLNYYVFQYSTGIISSMALSQKILSGEKSATEKYLSMLKAGGSDYPIKLLQTAGVDMTTIDPYNAAFKRFDDLVGEMEKIVERLEKEGKGI
jgi:oligoendopeptidase F